MDHRVNAEDIAFLFGTDAKYVRVLAHRARKGGAKQLVPEILYSYRDIQQPPSAALRSYLGVRSGEDSVVLDGAEKKRLQILSDTTEHAGSQFWSGVPFGSGLDRYRSLLPLIGYPGHYRRIRLLARLRQLSAETYLHSGDLVAALAENMKSLALSSVAYHESEDRHDLWEIGRTARLISQTFLLQANVSDALHYLNIHKFVCERMGLQLRPEYFHQQATLHFLAGEDDEARRCFRRAMETLADTVDFGKPKQPYEVLDIGMRQLHFLNANWEEAQALQQYMTRSLDPGDIHVSISANWTAGTAFQTDSGMSHLQAMDLLKIARPAAAGFSRQAVMTELLTITPHLPMKLRPAWARYCLYQNPLRTLP